MFIHIIPRRKGDLKNNDDIYGLIKNYDQEFTKYFINLFVIFE